jgi:hypothetical protein
VHCEYRRLSFEDSVDDSAEKAMTFVMPRHSNSTVLDFLAKSGASYVNHSADAAARCEAVADAKQSLKNLRRGLVDNGLTEDAEIDEAIAAWETWGSNPDAMYLRFRCECVARKGL